MKTTKPKTKTNDTNPPAQTETAPAPESQPPVIRIRARTDIGFGNVLTIRGRGAGLSWDKGMEMNCMNADLWTIALVGACTPVIFKVLVNDTTWNTGEDYIAQPGSDVTVIPIF